MNITKEQVLDALKNVIEPDLKKDIVSLGLVSGIEIEGMEISFKLRISNPALHSKKRMEQACEFNLERFISSDVEVDIEISGIGSEETDPNLRKILPGVKNIIAVASGKGGVGKSTVTANLAVTLAKMGFKVGVLDADVYGPSIPIMFDLANERPLSVVVDGKSKMKPIENYGVKVLSLGFFTQPNQAVIWRGPMAAKALNQLIFDAAWGDLDFMLIDLPPGTGDIHLSIMQSLPITGAVIVSTPQNVALADAKKGVAMFQQESINVPVLGIIENMAYFTPDELPNNKYYIFGKEGAKNLAEDLNTPFLGEIPLVQSIREAGDVGRPAALQTATALEKAFEEISKNVVQEVVNRNTDLPPTEAIKITTMAGCSAVKN
jgi:ATP-binding protein involved in chromosome partitioning